MANKKALADLSADDDIAADSYTITDEGALVLEVEHVEAFGVTTATGLSSAFRKARSAAVSISAERKGIPKISLVLIPTSAASRPVTAARHAYLT